MSLLKLNIIPEVYETRFRVRRIYITARQLMLLLIIYMLLLGTILLLARFILQREFTRIVNETSLVTADNRVLERKVDVMNDYVKGVSVVQKKHVQWSPLLIAITEAIPSGVVVSSISITTDSEATISGTAATRADLLNFKDTLTGIPAISKVDLPITDLVTAQNVSFKIQFSVSPEKMTQ